MGITGGPWQVIEARSRRSEGGPFCPDESFHVLFSVAAGRHVGPCCRRPFARLGGAPPSCAPRPFLASISARTEFFAALALDPLPASTALHARFSRNDLPVKMDLTRSCIRGSRA